MLLLGLPHLGLRLPFAQLTPSHAEESTHSPKF